MKKDIQQFILECVQEVISEHRAGDPTKEEMVDYLKGIFKNEADDFSIEEAIYWFGHHYHGGQNSNLYSALSTSKYRPGAIARGPEQDSMAEMMYLALRDKYAEPSAKEYPEETDSLPSAKDRIEPVWEAEYLTPFKNGDNKSEVAYDYGWGWGKFNREVGSNPQIPAGKDEYTQAYAVGVSDGVRGMYKNVFKPVHQPSRIDEAKGPITVTYSVAGLEQIPDSQHATKEEALKAAKEFIQSYATPKAKAAGEVMVRTQDGYALKHIGGGTVAFATMNISRRMKETSQPEPYDAETDTFQPSPHEREDEAPPTEWMYDPKYIGDTIEQVYGRQPSLQDIMEYFSTEYGQQAHSKLVKKVIERFSNRNPNFYIVLPKGQSLKEEDIVINDPKKVKVKVEPSQKVQETKGFINQCIDEVINEEVAKEGKCAALAAAGLIGLASLKGCDKNPISIPNPNQELPSEKNMDAWDLAGKYTDRNANVAKALKPTVDKYFGSSDVKEMIKESVVETLKGDLEIGSEQHGRYAQEAGATKLKAPDDYPGTNEGFDPQSNAGPNPGGTKENPYPEWNSQMQKMEETEVPVGNEQAERDSLSNQISDSYKELYGMRPRGINYYELPIEQLRTIAKDLQKDLQDQWERDEREEQQHQASIKKAMTPQKWSVGDVAGLKEDETTPTSPAISTSLIDGQSNNVAASRVNKILSSMSQGMFSDDSWQPINAIFKKLQELGLNVNLTKAQYGGQAEVPSGMPKYKEWQISIPFTNKNGKPTVLVGQITAHGAGSVDQPLDRYDITAYVSPMSVKA